MGPRLLILLVVAAGMAVLLATRTRSRPLEAASDESTLDDPEGRDIRLIREQQKMLCDRELPGQQVEAAPTVQVTVDPTGKKNRLFFLVTEPNGFYVDGLSIQFFHKRTPDSTFEDSRLKWTEIINKYVKANEPLRSCIEIVPAELARIDGHIGTDANWAAEVVDYCHARAKNPEPLPTLAEATSCD